MALRTRNRRLERTDKMKTQAISSVSEYCGNNYDQRTGKLLVCEKCKKCINDNEIRAVVFTEVDPKNHPGPFPPPCYMYVSIMLKNWRIIEIQHQHDYFVDPDGINWIYGNLCCPNCVYGSISFYNFNSNKIVSEMPSKPKKQRGPRKNIRY